MRFLEAVVALLRRLVYWVGFWPAYGSVLYSPSKALQIDAEQAHEAFLKGYDLALEAQPVTVKSSTTLYERMVFCMQCGYALEPYLMNVKECPRGCGSFYTTETKKGRPAAMFESNYEGVRDAE